MELLAPEDTSWAQVVFGMTELYIAEPSSSPRSVTETTCTARGSGVDWVRPDVGGAHAAVAASAIRLAPAAQRYELSVLRTAM